ncbi:hypothetical protein MVES1_001420 [Malassezia vespertilionis]|uniref:PLD phosphodiesterase domain-containing protein n=1 Tax=Malassezia vespertilionis TaxID=2020962 RepID=A0A2N1JFF3_9BASI|nr:uncharacterized protein MVES1_001420 [Malassezia vespertilionis]PKI85260.1 hypothetical protein MVES_001338 [Malassezia vespertilionis]WFD06080.1 hypothetical protein MVES1_001420 [Malassezia vespertilionis]
MPAAAWDDTVSGHVAKHACSPTQAMRVRAQHGTSLHHFLEHTPLARRARHWDWRNGATSARNSPPSDEELAFVRNYFKYEDGPNGPSKLYLMLLTDCMLTLKDRPWMGVVSPPLLATTGVLPLSIFSTGPDIIDHYYNCIIEAKREVILLTNYWQQGKNVDKIAAAIRELNKRAAARGDTIVMKIMWDRGPRTVGDLFRLRTPILPAQWAANGLPASAELTNIELEILNYHRPLMGTFHAKLLLVDRKVALLNSINIQDRPNLEACVRLEGDIVNAVYDHALISWGNPLRPMLPCLDSPASPTVSDDVFILGGNNSLPHVSDKQREQMGRMAREQLIQDDQETLRQQPVSMRVHIADIVEQMIQARAGATDTPQTARKEPVDSDHAVRRAAAIWTNKTHGNNRDNTHPSAPAFPQTIADSALRMLGKDSSSSWNVQYELHGRHGRGVSEEEAKVLARITSSLDFANNSQVQGELKPEVIENSIGGWQAQRLMGLLEFEPLVFHSAHAPVPMALVNRRPRGLPGHGDIANPQAAAWLAGFRYAKKHVFIQSPTLNASPIKAAILACVRRSVRVELWLDLGFNDKSESMPFQGGTNEQVVSKMYRTLRREGQGREKYLDVYWYTGKDMDRPLNAVRKQRNCHVKFAAFDGEVGILGSGNQDTQSWFHSQEINVMVDSKQIVSEWVTALRRNQSTHLYGKVDQQLGIWRGKGGDQMPDTGKDGVPESA